jgi:hypothetical protein
MGLFSNFFYSQPAQNQFGSDIILSTAVAGGSYPGTGTIWNDLSGLNNNGTLSSTTGVTYNTVGTDYLWLKGSNAANNITFNPSSYSSTFLSVSVWVNFAPASGQTGTKIWFKIGSGNDVIFSINMTTGKNSVTLVTSDGTNTSSKTITGTNVLTNFGAGSFNLVFTYGNSVLSYYENGNYIGSVNYPYSKIRYSTNSMIFQTSEIYINFFEVIEKQWTASEVNTNSI